MRRKSKIGWFNFGVVVCPMLLYSVLACAQTQDQLCALVTAQHTDVLTMQGQKKILTFRQNTPVDQVLYDILQFHGLYFGDGVQHPFEVRATDSVIVRQNAAAILCADNQRYIVYDQQWVDSLGSVHGKVWPEYGVFAHEIGHHLLNHTLNQTGPCKERELAADQFAGYTLARMGATVDETLSGVSKLSPLVSDECHPDRCRRRVAMIQGYNMAASQMSKATYYVVNSCDPSLTEASKSIALAQDTVSLGQQDSHPAKTITSSASQTLSSSEARMTRDARAGECLTGALFSAGAGSEINVQSVRHGCLVRALKGGTPLTWYDITASCSCGN